MDSLKRKLLKNEIQIQLAKAKLTSDILKQVKKEERKDFIDIKLLEVNDASLRWALQNKVISQNDLITDSFFVENSRMRELIAQVATGIAGGALTTVGAMGGFVGFVVSLTPVTTGGFLGIFASTTYVATSATLAVTAAPIALAGAGIYGIIKYKENQEIKKLIDHFELEKEKILNFYLYKIENLKLLEA